MDSQEDQTKKPSKKDLAKAERLRRKQELAAASAGVSSVSIDEPDPLASNYGEIPLIELQSKSISSQKRTNIGTLVEKLKGESVLVRGRVHSIIEKDGICYCETYGVYGAVHVDVKPEKVSLQMVKFVTNLNKKSFVDVHGLVSVPDNPLKATTQQTLLENSSIDVAVFCLSLMGTNFPSYLREAQRVLKQSGWLLIAEVKSRFDPTNGGADPNRFSKAICELGFYSVSKDFSNKMFILFYFKKKEKLKSKKEIDWPSLKPCLYKRR